MRRARGFTYVGLLIAVAMAGALLAAVGTFWSTDSKRDREKELLFAGDQFRVAIGAYYNESPAGQPHKFPAKLDDLLNDKRWPTTRRHLRKIYVDPMTGNRDWVVVRAADQTIIGVHSASEDTPLKRANFSEEYKRFETAKTYRDWQFVFKQAQPQTPPRAGSGADNLTQDPPPRPPTKGTPASEK